MVVLMIDNEWCVSEWVDQPESKDLDIIQSCL